MNNRNIDSLWDFSETSKTIDQINELLRNIMTILLVIVLVISFFSLVTTSYVNIINQCNEIAILMTLGFQKYRVIMIFIYEALFNFESLPSNKEHLDRVTLVTITSSTGKNFSGKNLNLLFLIFICLFLRRFVFN